MDYSACQAVNEFVFDNAWLGRLLAEVETWAVPLLAAATFALWLLARPGGSRKWKLASASVLAASGVALLVNQIIAKLWSRERPFAAHHSAHVWGSRSHDPSFPSDHASAAYAIAFTVFMFDRVAGSIFLAAATVIGVGRILVGAHYPADVLAGILVGLGAALLVVRTGKPLLTRLVLLVERVTDPIVAPLWRRAGRRGLQTSR
jgi:undecaprenyl-diphosphatase